MKKITVSIIMLIGVLVACDHEQRMPLLKASAVGIGCSSGEAMCETNNAMTCVGGAYYMTANCQLQGKTCTTDSTACGGEVGKSACCM